MDWFLVKKTFATLVLPPTGLLIVSVIGLALLGSRPRLGRAFAWFGVVVLLLLSLPIVSYGLSRTLSPPAPLDPARAREAQAIVILGSGLRRGSEFGGETLGRLTLERVRYGARVAKATKLPVLVSGGSVYGGTAEAALMQRALEEEFGVKVRWAEDRSRDTRTNAAESAAILMPAGVRRIILVAHGVDMPRASAEFVSAGLQVVAAPTAIADRFSFHSAVELLPSMSALQGSYHAIYELVAQLVRRMRTD